MRLRKSDVTGNLAAIWIVFVLSIPSYSGTGFYDFLQEPVSSSITGMGAAGTGSGMGGYTFYNPAGLGLRDNSFVSFDFSKIDDFGRGYIESGWAFPTWFVGGSFQTQAINDVQRTDITGVLDDAFAPVRGTMLSILTGIKRDRYSLGVALNGVQEVIGDYTSYGFSGSAGLIVNVIPEHLTVGVAGIHAAGRHNSFMDQKEKLKLERFPATVRAGVCLMDSLLDRFPTKVTVDVVYSDNDEIVTVPVGIDFQILPPVTIRIGKRINFEAELFSAGVGFQWENIRFDASFTPFKLDNDNFLKRSIALTYSLPSVRKASEKKRNDSPAQKIAPQKEDNAVIEVIVPDAPVPEVKVDTVLSDTAENQQEDSTAVTDTLSKTDAVDTTAHSASDTSNVLTVQEEGSAAPATDQVSVPVEAVKDAPAASENTANVPPAKAEVKDAVADTGTVQKTVPDTTVVPATQDTLKTP
jgi:hypothetical protein